MTFPFPFMTRALAGGAYPIIANYATYTPSGRVSTHNVTLPTGITAGDCLVIFFSGGATAGARTMTVPSGWTAWYNEAGDGDLRVVACIFKKASGSEGSTQTINFSNNVSGAAISLRITGMPDFDFGGGNILPAMELKTPTIHANTSTSNPPSYTRLIGASTDHMIWFTPAHYFDDADVSVVPTDFTKFTTAVGTECSVTLATQSIITETIDPSTFTLPSSCRSVTTTGIFHGT